MPVPESAPALVRLRPLLYQLIVGKHHPALDGYRGSLNIRSSQRSAITSPSARTTCSCKDDKRRWRWIGFFCDPEESHDRFGLRGCHLSEWCPRRRSVDCGVMVDQPNTVG
jgi:hypothetical protein